MGSGRHWYLYSKVLAGTLLHKKGTPGPGDIRDPERHTESARIGGEAEKALPSVAQNGTSMIGSCQARTAADVRLPEPSRQPASPA